MSCVRGKYDWDHSEDHLYAGKKGISVANTSNITNGYGPTYVHLNPIASGTGSGDRVGRVVNMVHYTISIRCYPQPTNEMTAGSSLRIAILYDKQPNGSGPPAGIFANEGDIVAITSNLLNSYQGRFIILEDFIIPFSGVEIPVGAITAGTTGNYYAFRQRNISLPAIWSSTTSTSITTGRLSLVYWFANSANSYSMFYNFDLDYEDS